MGDGTAWLGVARVARVALNLHATALRFAGFAPRACRRHQPALPALPASAPVRPDQPRQVRATRADPDSDREESVTEYARYASLARADSTCALAARTRLAEHDADREERGSRREVQGRGEKTEMRFRRSLRGPAGPARGEIHYEPGIPAERE